MRHSNVRYDYIGFQLLCLFDQCPSVFDDFQPGQAIETGEQPEPVLDFPARQRLITRRRRYPNLKGEQSGSNSTRILEKPEPAIYDSLPEPVLVSLNCWRFSSPIFLACEKIPESERGELELTAAVQYCIDELGESFRVSTSTAPVLDLSERGDIAAVASYIEGLEVDL